MKAKDFSKLARALIANSNAPDALTVGARLTVSTNDQMGEGTRSVFYRVKGLTLTHGDQLVVELEPA